MTDEPSARPPTGSERSAEQTFRVRFEEAGPSGTIRSSVLLRYAAELAWVHSERRGFRRSWYRERDLAWVVRGVDLRILGPIEDGSIVVGTTRVGAARKVLARRRTEFRSHDGSLAALVDVDWAMTTSSGAPTRIPEAFGVAFGLTPDSVLTPVRVRLVPPTDPPASSTDPPAGSTVRRHELDPMNHVNNAVYLDWAEEAVASAGGPIDDLPRRWRLEFLGAAGPTSRIRRLAWPTDGGWACLITDPSTDERFVGATLSTGDLDLDDTTGGPAAGS
jgi:acyl-CoA thioesterase FadM